MSLLALRPNKQVPPTVQMARRVAATVRRAAVYQAKVHFPTNRWVRDPVLFAQEVLGIDLWQGQIEIVESIRDHRNTTVRSGHKCGKTTAIAVAALWFFATFANSRVILLANSAKQVDEVIWREVKRLYHLSQSGKYPLDGEIMDLARSGLRHNDGRQIFGVTARKDESLAGISGANILVLIDEASGVEDKFFEVLSTSLAGGGGTVRQCYISNPTRTHGAFYRSHNQESALFNCIALSSEETPNARGLVPIPGLASSLWIDECKVKWGVDSYTYRVRIKGEFVQDLDGRIISLDTLRKAQEAWALAPNNLGPLQIGCDPAGDGIAGDETAIAVRRGQKLLTVRTWRGLSVPEIAEHLYGIVAEFRLPRESMPTLAVDDSGGIGSELAGTLRARLRVTPNDFDLKCIHPQDKMWGNPTYKLVRDSLWGEAANWLQGGGAIISDELLAEELNFPTFEADERNYYCATHKDEIRKALGRSPDRADAVCLAIYGYAAYVAPQQSFTDVHVAGPPTVQRSRVAPRPMQPVRGWDPYGKARPR